MQISSAFIAIDAVNTTDPHLEQGVPRALLYGQRMSAMLGAFFPHAPDALQIAVRAQHIERWKVARTDFEQGKHGYHAWRKACAEYHAVRTAALLNTLHAPSSLVERVVALIKKEHFKTDADAQTLEDVACLVFLRYEAEAFFAKTDSNKLPAIVRKTWAKMSEKGHQYALATLTQCPASVHATVTSVLHQN